MSRARPFWLMPMGIRNSSSSTSPGCALSRTGVSCLSDNPRSPQRDPIVLSSWREYALGRGPIQHHVREWIALGIALVEQRRDHIQLHARSALDFGAPPEEIFEVMPIALLMDGAPALSQIPHLVDALDNPPLAMTA
jgi:alkylhydroperoxidase/carboxymuconolactone decarboxylase family protein YurZ